MGRCQTCSVPYDTLSGSRICAVCRDLVLICPPCASHPDRREYHCRRHFDWSDAYLYFVEPYSREELERQSLGLEKIHDAMLPAKKYKNGRRTLRKQMGKVRDQLGRLERGEVSDLSSKGMTTTTAPRRCRTCGLETEGEGRGCDGLCWGFWKRSGGGDDREKGEGDDEASPPSVRGPIAEGPRGGKDEKERNDGDDDDGGGTDAPTCPPPLPPAEQIRIGDRVEPGPDWNASRHGSPTYHRHSRHRHRRQRLSERESPSPSPPPRRLLGTVREIKSWGSGGRGGGVAAAVIASGSSGTTTTTTTTARTMTRTTTEATAVVTTTRRSDAEGGGGEGSFPRR